MSKQEFGIIAAALFAGVMMGPVSAQHRGQHHGHQGAAYASPAYAVPYIPPMNAPYRVSPRVYATGTRDSSGDRLYAVPSQVQMMGMSDIEYRATILSNLYRSGAISSQQYQETWNRIASER